jgi:alpha-mannosidase
LLRNEFFDVQLSDVTGGIAKISTYRRSPNRVSQQLALRFPHEKTISVGAGEDREAYKTFYTAMQLRESRILSAGPLIGEIETLGDLLDEQSGTVLATYRQRTRVARGRPVIEIDVELAPSQPVAGDPWTNYVGCRFAWRHEDAALTASMQQGAQPLAGQRLEAPQYIEIADESFRTTLLTPGLPFHRKTGERMLDTLLLAEGETARRFQFAIAIDAKYPLQAQLDQYSPPVVIPTSTRPGETSRQGWFFSLSAANVQLTRILPSPNPNSLIIRLLETEGRARVFGLQCFRPPVSARQVNFLGETIATLQLDDAVNVEISPYEICDIELSL